MIRIIPVSRLCKQCMSPLAPMHGIRLLDRSTHAPAASLSNAEASDEALKWRKDYRLTGEGSRNHCKVVTEDGYTIQSDIPKSMGGRDSAPQPVYLLLAALTGCETATANYVARQMKMRLKGISFRIDAWRDQRGAIGSPTEIEHGDFRIPSHLQSVSGTALVDTDGTQAQVDELAHEVHLRCPVASMMAASGCRLDIKWLKADPGQAME